MVIGLAIAALFHLPAYLATGWLAGSVPRVCRVGWI